MQFQVGDKVKLKPEYNGKCPRTSHRDRAYLVVDDVNSYGDLISYTAYTEEGIKINSCSSCIRFKHVEPYNNFEQSLKEKNTMKTTQLKAGDKLDTTDVLVAFKSAGQPSRTVGEKFVLVRNEHDYGLSRFLVVELNRNDNSAAPNFIYSETGANTYMRWSDLSEIPSSLIKAEKPSVISTATFYSDGVKVSEGKVEFDGKNWEREELEKTVKRFQEILKRPFATVALPVTEKKIRKPRTGKVINTSGTATGSKSVKA